MKPPRVYEETKPKSHNTNKITKMVHSRSVSFFDVSRRSDVRTPTSLAQFLAVCSTVNSQS